MLKIYELCVIKDTVCWKRKRIMNILLIVLICFSSVSLSYAASSQSPFVLGNKSANPLRAMARDFRSLVSVYRQKKDLAEKLGVKNNYENLYQQAKDLVKELEVASDLHDAYMNQYQKGDMRSGKKAIHLAQLMRHKRQPFNALLWRMEKLISEISKEDERMPQPCTHPLPLSTAPLSPPRSGIIKKKPMTANEQPTGLFISEPTVSISATPAATTDVPEESQKTPTRSLPLKKSPSADNQPYTPH